MSRHRFLDEDNEFFVLVDGIRTTVEDPDVSASSLYGALAYAAKIEADLRARVAIIQSVQYPVGATGFLDFERKADDVG